MQNVKRNQGACKCLPIKCVIPCYKMEQIYTVDLVANVVSQPWL
jgi:hypothetical protein